MGFCGEESGITTGGDTVLNDAVVKSRRLKFSAFVLVEQQPRCQHNCTETEEEPMTVSMGIRHRESGEYEVVPVATNASFRRVWLPACEKLCLQFIPLFADGALTRVPTELVPQIIDEVSRLQRWAVARPDEYLQERCGDILAAFARTNPAMCDYDFG